MEIFNLQFKFKINDSVRHRGDNHKRDSDMGLLVLERHLIESLDAEDKVTYERSYVCRMIRWSGSGDLARFNERELISVADHDAQKIKEDVEHDSMRRSAKMVEREIMEYFGISKEDYLYEIVNGVPDDTKKFRMSGFSQDESGIKLFVTESIFTAANRKAEGQKLEAERREWTSKDQFVKV
jgi:hypothetical protein